MFKFFEILCSRDCRKAFIWHSPRENRLLWDTENEGHMNARKVYLNYMSCTMCPTFGSHFSIIYFPYDANKIFLKNLSRAYFNNS